MLQPVTTSTFLMFFLFSFLVHLSIVVKNKKSKKMDQGGGVLELHSQDLKMPHTMIMQDFGTGKYEFFAKYNSSIPVCLSLYLSIYVAIVSLICNDFTQTLTKI